MGLFGKRKKESLPYDSIHIKEDERKIVSITGVLLDLNKRCLYVDGQREDLTPQECQLFEYLIINKRKVLTIEEILEDVWKHDYLVNGKTVDWLVKHLRQKLGKYGEKIRTVRGKGYRLDD